MHKSDAVKKSNSGWNESTTSSKLWPQQLPDKNEDEASAAIVMS